MERLDAALLALEAEIFAEDSVLTGNDEFLVRALSQWSVTERKESLSALIQRYGTPDIGTQIVHALARLICRDVALKLDQVFGRVNHHPG
jgi:hypothetical protein